MTLFDRLRTRVLAALKVPHEPEPPLGAPESVRVFRAGLNFYRLRLFGLGVGQFFALLGIIFWVVVLLAVELEATSAARQRQEMAETARAIAALRAEAAVTNAAAATTETPASPPAKKARSRARPADEPKQDFARLVASLPAWAFGAMWALKVVGFLIYLAQAAVTYAILRLDYEQRWYIVTDRSLRIRSGIWSVQEMTMSFANLQQVVVSQGPLQRLLSIADVRVQSAGGGGVEPGQHGQNLSLHTGVFHGVDNAREIRDLILERLRLFRETGLGDPDEAQHTPAAPSMQATISAAPAVHAAARELLEEARALRRAVD